MHKIMFFLALWLPVVGCETMPDVGRASHFEIIVDAIAAKSVRYKNVRYIIIPKEKSIQANDLRFQELATMIERALSEKGYQRVPDIKGATIAVAIHSSVGDPQTYKTTRAVPIYGYSPGKTYNLEIDSDSASGMYGKSGLTKYGTIKSTRSSSGSIKEIPTYGVQGYYTDTTEHTIYAKFLAVTAYDIYRFRQTGRLKDSEVLWDIKTSTADASNDLRRINPYLVSAAAQYFGKSTRGQVTVEVSDEDGVVDYIRTGRYPSDMGGPEVIIDDE